MLSFPVTGEVSEICDCELRLINDYKLRVVKLKIGKSLSIYAYLDPKQEIKVGDIIQSDTAYLTNHDDSRTPKDLALRFGEFKVVSTDEFEPKDYIDVYCNGKFIKSKKAQVSLVGITKKPFIPCTLSIKNEIGSIFNVLLIGSYAHAERLDQICTNTYVNVRARLYNQINKTGFELNVQEIEELK